MKKFKSYWRKYFIVTFFLLFFSASISKLAILQPFESFNYSIFIFYAVISPFIFWWACSGITSKNNYKFVATVTGSMTVKLLLSVIFIVGYAMITKPAEGTKPFFIIPFFVDYCCFTILEVVEMVKLSKASSAKISSTDSVLKNEY